MDNPETLVTFGTLKNTNTTQHRKLKRRATRTQAKNGGEVRWSRMRSHVPRKVKTYWTPQCASKHK